MRFALSSLLLVVSLIAVTLGWWSDHKRLSDAIPQLSTSLQSDVVDLTIQHIKRHGPDFETARHTRYAWPRRQEIVALVAPHLHGTKPEKVAAALATLSRLRGGVSGLGNYTKFFSEIDQIVYDQLDHLHSLESDMVSKHLALYLNHSQTVESKRNLLKIIESPFAKHAKEQALTCLAWRRDPNDIAILLPYMLEGNADLPYQFRSCYGEAAIPYLKQTISDAKSRRTQLEAAFQLVHMRVPDGFRYLRTLVLDDPKPEGKNARASESIMFFSRDYLGLPGNTISPEGIAKHIEKKQGELCKKQQVAGLQSVESFDQSGSPGIAVFNGNNRPDLVSSRLMNSWSKISLNMKKRMQHYLLFDLGLSSTGTIQLIGFYGLTERSDFGEKGDRVCHFLQQDLFGDRLFWSCLINVDRELTKVLYTANAKEGQISIGHLPASKSAEEADKSASP